MVNMDMTVIVIIIEIVYNYMFSPVFIYSMPGYSVSIKERMLYSSCKNSVVEAIQKVRTIYSANI